MYFNYLNNICSPSFDRGYKFTIANRPVFNEGFGVEGGRALKDACGGWRMSSIYC